MKDWTKNKQTKKQTCRHAFTLSRKHEICCFAEDGKEMLPSSLLKLPVALLTNLFLKCQIVLLVVW